MELSLGKWANALQAAAQTGQLRVVGQLVKQGSAIDKPGYRNRTTLHLACLEGNDMVVQYLIEVSANVMARDDELDTPLHLALKGLRGSSKVGSLLIGFLRTVQWLLIGGADIMLSTKNNTHHLQ
jgi:ankyrin repeat protein